MSRFNSYNNIHDPDDDGADIEFTEQDYARSDDQGCQEAVVLLQTGNAIKGTGKHVHDQRRMFYRWAKKELVDGRARREAAAAAEKAAVVAEKARLAAEEKAAKDKAAKEAKHARDLEKFRRDGQESEERWARINEETRVANASWEAGRDEREAAEREQKVEVRPRPIQMPATRPSEVRPQRRPASPATSVPIRHAAPSLAPTPITTAGSSPNRTTSAAGSVPTAPARSAARLPQAAPPSQTQPATRTSGPPDLVRRPAPRLHSEPQRRVASTQPAWAPPATEWPPRSPSTTTVPLPSPGRAAAETLVVVPESRCPARPVPGRVLTGADLAAWRAARGFAQRPAAELLGVAPSTVAKAELLPAKVLGNQLQVALAAALAR